MGSRNIRKTHNKYLKNPKIAAEYINEALETNDTSVILMAIRNVVDAQEGGISGVAERAMLGRESMYKMLSSKGNPKLSTLNNLFHGLGLKIEVHPGDEMSSLPNLNKLTSTASEATKARSSRGN